jgi:hypothetical protein
VSTIKSYRELSPQGLDARNPNAAATARNAAFANSPGCFRVSFLPHVPHSNLRGCKQTPPTPGAKARGRFITIELSKIEIHSVISSEVENPCVGFPDFPQIQSPQRTRIRGGKATKMGTLNSQITQRKSVPPVTTQRDPKHAICVPVRLLKMECPIRVPSQNC